MELNLKNIINILHEAKFADSDWELLGLQLINHTVLTTIRANHHGSGVRCMLETIDQWLKSDLEPSWEKLAEAVAKVEGYGEAIADIVRHNAGIGKADLESGCD